MLWPIVLPFKIAFWSLVGLVLLVTAFSPALHWKRGVTLLASTILACLAFVPSCAGIMAILDTQRFGVFHHDAYDSVDDFRIERYLPTEARNITLDKFAMGHRAKYSISESDFLNYLDRFWSKYSEGSAISREELSIDTRMTEDEFIQNFGDLDWVPLQNAFEYHSPVQRDGGGATYFYDRDAEIAYHRAGYW